MKNKKINAEVIREYYNKGYEVAIQGGLRAPILHININAISDNCINICNSFLKGYDTCINEELLDILGE